MNYIVFLVLSLFGHAQPNTMISVVIETSEEIKPVIADVVIKAGKVVSSNCDQLGLAEGSTEYTLQLDADTNTYNCVPNDNKKILQERIDVDLGFEPTSENFRKNLEAFTKAIKAQKGSTQPTPPQPQCSLDSSGNIDLESCVCGAATEGYKFNKTTKSCESSTSGVLELYVADCSEQWSDVGGLLEEIGYNTVEPESVQFGMCVEWRNLRYYIPSQDLIYKMLYFSYWIKPQLANQIPKDEKVEAIKLFVSQQELRLYENWVLTKASDLQAEVELLPVIGYGDVLSLYQEKVKTFAQELQAGYILQDLVVIEKP